MNGVVFKVKTEALVSAADELTKSVNETQNAFQQMEDIINASVGYWEGRGHDAMVSTFMTRSDDYERIFKAIKTHASNLVEIADRYSSEDRSNITITEALPGDVIE